MQQWEDWNEEGKLSDSWLYLRLVLFLCTGLTIPWLYIAWSTQRKEAPAQLSVELPERLRSGKSYEVNDSVRIEDEVYSSPPHAWLALTEVSAMHELYTLCVLQMGQASNEIRLSQLLQQT